MKKIFLFLLLSSLLTARAQYNSLFWKITGNGIKHPSYIYGTMHTADARVFAFGDSVLPYFAQTKAYAMELDPKQGFDMSIITKLMMGRGYSLKTMLPAKEYALLDSLVKKQIGYSVGVFDNVAPVFTMTIIEAGAMELSDSSIEGNKEVLDLYFYKLAKQKKKKIIGIETVDEQLSALNSLSYQEQADLLLKELQSMQDSKEMPDVLQYYLDQNLDSLATNDADAMMPEKFYKALVTVRNVRMADRIADFIQKQSVFVAVGALHLPKADGVIALLRQKGFTVEPIKNK